MNGWRLNLTSKGMYLVLIYINSFTILYMTYLEVNRPNYTYPALLVLFLFISNVIFELIIMKKLYLPLQY